MGALLAGCSDGRPSAPASPNPKPETQQPQVTDSPSMQFLPREQEVEGWVLEKDPEVWPAESLASYFAREAERFQRYEIVDLTVGEYTRTRGDGFAVVEIFRFPDFVQAFGAYSAHRRAVVNFLDIGNESFVGPHSIHLWTGPFYVRIIGGGAAGLIDPMKQLAATIAEGMPRASSRPAVFEFLPDTYRRVHSERYVADPVLGQPVLSNAFTATFEIGEDEVMGLIIPAPSKEAATKILNAYRSFYAANGRLLDPIPNLGEDNFTGEDRFAGRTIAFRLDRFVVAFNGFVDKQRLLELAADSDQRILRAIRRQLQARDKAAGDPS